MNESIGAALRAGREQRRLTLAQVSEATRIRGHYLQALENDDLSAMPSAAQGRGFMRIYAQFLGLDLDALIPPAAPPPVTAPEAPTKPVQSATISLSDAEAAAAAGSAAPTLVSGLRDRIIRRLRRRSAASAPEADSTDKKKKETRG